MVYLAFIYATICAFIATKRFFSAEPFDHDEQSQASKPFLLPLPFIILIAGLLVLGCLTLETYIPSLLTWECETTDGFLKNLNDKTLPLDFIRQYLTWTDAPLSASYGSLVFSLPTYLLLYLEGFNLWALRLFPLVASILLLLAIFLTVRQLGRPVAGFFSILFFVSFPLFIFYARYGVSLAPSLLVACTALWAASVLCRKRTIASAIVFFVTLVLTTYCYSPIRLFGIGMFLGSVLHLLLWKPRRPIPLLLLFLLCGLLFFWQYQSGGIYHYLSGRGEQVVRMMEVPSSLAEAAGLPADDVIHYKSEGRFLPIVTALAISRLKEIAYVLSPWIKTWPTELSILIVGDPPNLPLYAPLLWPFVFAGFVMALRRWKEPLPFLSFAAFGACLLPLLLTNRADLHRMAVLAIPSMVWCCFSIDAFLGSPVRRTRILALSILPLLSLWLIRPLFLLHEPSPLAISKPFMEEIQKAKALTIWLRQDCKDRYFFLYRLLGELHGQYPNITMMNSGIMDRIENGDNTLIKEICTKAKDQLFILSEHDVQEFGEDALSECAKVTWFESLAIIKGQDSTLPEN